MLPPGRQDAFFPAYKDLREGGALSKELLNVKDAFYIVKLKSRQVDPTPADPKNLETIAQSMAVRQGYRFMQQFSEAWLDSLEKDLKISKIKKSEILFKKI